MLDVLKAVHDTKTGNEILLVELKKKSLEDLKDIPMIPCGQLPFAGGEKLTIEICMKQPDVKTVFQIRSSDDGRFIVQTAEQILALKELDGNLIPFAKQDVYAVVDSFPLLADYSMLAESVAGYFLDGLF